MDERTHKALLASKEKWERNAEAETPDDYKIHADTCPLCTIYAEDLGCVGCPVSKKTGRVGCDGSPWEEAFDALFDWGLAHNGGRKTKRLRKEAHAAARKEVEFLKGLLPERSDQS